MTDLYRRELDIPEKSRMYGWLVVAVGVLMLFFALRAYWEDASQLEQMKTSSTAERKLPAAENAQEIAVDPAQAAEGEAITAEDAQEHPVDPGRQARLMLWAVILVLIIALAFLVIVIVSHRLALHIRRQTSFHPKKTEFVDPWKQSAERLKIDPPDQADR